MKLRTTAAAWFAGLLGMAGCTEVETARVPPIADSGLGQVVLVGERATLDGSGSHLADGSSAAGNLTWSAVSLPDGSSATLSNVSAVDPWFEVDIAGDYIFRLVVVEDDLASEPSLVVVRGYRALEVVYQTPPDASFEAPHAAPVVLAFSEPLQPETVTPESVYVRHSTGLVSGFVEVHGGNTLVSFTPAAEYPAGVALTVVVTQRVVAVSGASLPAAYVGRFQVAAGADARGPAVANISPADQATEVAATASLILVFDEPIDPVTVTVDLDRDDCYDNLTVVNAASSECVPASVATTAAGTHVVWTPLASFSAGDAFDVTVRGGVLGVQDVAGNVLAADFTSQFTVSAQADATPLAVASVYPGPGVRGVPIGVSIAITFNRPVLESSINDQSIAVVRGTTPAAAAITVSMGGTVVTLAPEALLQPSTEYSVVARGAGATAVLDRAGASLDGDGDGNAGGDYLSRFVTTDTPSFNGEFTLPSVVVPGNPISVILSDRDLDTSGDIQVVQVTAASSTGEIETITLFETGARTGVFEGNVATRFVAGAGMDEDGRFNVQVDDLITFSYLDEVSAAGGQRFEIETVLVAGSVAQIFVSTISGDTTEGGGTATFAVNLASEPTGDVILTFDSDDATEGEVIPTTMTFSPSNYSSPQIATVTGIDDDVVDGDVTYAILFNAAESSDGAYNGFTPDAIELENLDNDTSDIQVSTLDGFTAEWDATTTATFTVVLESRPSADVTITFDSDDPTEGRVSPTELVFTRSNWNQAQTVTVTGEPDEIDDGNIDYFILFDPTVSSDAAFNDVQLPAVTVKNLDDDTAGFAVPPLSLAETTEWGGTTAFSVRLTSEPIADVTLRPVSETPAEGRPSPSTLTFSSENWDEDQTVTVTGQDDTVQDGDQTYYIVFNANITDDPKYESIRPGQIAITNLDDDTPGFAFRPFLAETSESGGTTAFRVRLTSLPTADVTLNLASSDSTEGIASPSTLTFTPDNWREYQSVTVTGQDDTVQDGDQDYRIEFSANATTDPAYQSIQPDDITLTNLDND